MDEVEKLGDTTYKLAGLDTFQVNQRMQQFNLDQCVIKDDRVIQRILSRGLLNNSSVFLASWKVDMHD